MAGSPRGISMGLERVREPSLLRQVRTILMVVLKDHGFIEVMEEGKKGTKEC
jgi:hypothetical protein